MDEPAIDAVADQLSAFVAGMTRHREPDTDIPRGEEIGARILATCTPDPWDDGAWQLALDRLSKRVADQFPLAPDQWVEALHLLDVYFDNTWIIGEHPARGTLTRGRRGGESRRNVGLDLGRRVARLVLPGWSPKQRFPLWAAMAAAKHWDVWRAIMPSFKELDLAVPEVVEALTRLETFSTGDLGAGELQAAVEEWARKCTRAARAVIESWRKREHPADTLALVIIARLATVLCQASTSDADLRETMVRELSRPARGPDGAELATQMRLFAWPSGTPTCERVASLVEAVAENPWTQRAPALWALGGLARTEPEAAIQGADGVLALLPPTSDEPTRTREAHAIARILQHLTWGAKRGDGRVLRGAAVFAGQVVDRLLPEVSGEGWDGYLAALAAIAPDLARDLLGAWLVRWSAQLLASSIGFDEHFPLLVGSARTTPGRIAGWLLGFAASPDVRLWRVALHLRSSSRSLGDPGEGASELDDAQLRATARRLLATGFSRSGHIEAVLAWAFERPTIATDLVQLIATAGVERFPGVTESAVQGLRLARSATVDGDLLAPVERALAARKAAWAARLLVKDGLFAVPTRESWAELERQQMRRFEERERLSGRHPLLLVIPRVAVARGAGTVHAGAGGGPTRVTPFARIEVGGEFPARDAFDPVGAHRERTGLLSAAEAILAERRAPT